MKNETFLSPPRFTVGQEVSWPQGRCTLRIAGPPSVSGDPPTSWYGGPILTGENVGGYVLSVPEEQLAAMPTQEDGDAA